MAEPPKKAAPKGASAKKAPIKVAAAPAKKQGLAKIFEEVQRRVGLIEDKVATRKVDGFLTLDELEVSDQLKARLEEAVDRNGDGKLSLAELEVALKKGGLDARSEKVLRAAIAAVSQEVMQLYTEALDHFTAVRGRLEALRGRPELDPKALELLLARGEKIHALVQALPEVLRKDPDAIKPVRDGIRGLLKLARDLEG